MATRVRGKTSPRKKTRAPARRTPVQQRSSATVDAILEATVQILARDGHAGLTTNAIAGRAGISVGSLYQYFPHKQAIIDALLRRHAERVQPLLTAAVVAAVDLPLEDALETAVRALIAADTVDLRMAQIFHQLTPAGPGSPVDEFETAIEAMVAEILVQHGELRVADPALAAAITVRATSGVLRSTARRTPALLTAPAFAAELTALLRGYLRSLTERA